MKTSVLLGILLIAVGVIALAYQGITYTRNKTILDVGPLKAQVEEKRTIPLPPVLGAVSLAGGIALLVAGTRPMRAA
jgi:uncharacterized membrane protein HdeD (DUF308 family)